MFTNTKKLARRLATPQVGARNKALEIEQVTTNFYNVNYDHAWVFMLVIPIFANVLFIVIN
jgi:hypothetical protein